MEHFTQRPLWSPLAVVICGACGWALAAVLPDLLADPYLVRSGFWFLPVLFGGLPVWAWWHLGRPAARRLVVDDDGVHVAGRLAVPAASIRAVSAAADHTPVQSLCLRKARPGRSWSFLASAWLRVLELDGLGPVVISHDRDLGRGTGFDGVVVVTGDTDEGHPAAWYLPSLRCEELAVAVLGIAPQAHVAVAHEPRPSLLGEVEPPAGEAGAER